MPNEQTDALILTPAQRKSSPQLAWVDGVTRLLDTRFRVPGTNLRFGADFLLGLIPGAGDLMSMGFSGLLVATMAKNGASGRLVAKMLGNVILDTVVGSIPILGNLFDLVYKANVRNLTLMREHYDEDKHTGSAWPIVAAVVATMIVLLVVTVWLLTMLFRWIWHWT